MTLDDIEEQQFGSDFYMVDKNLGFKYWHDTHHKNINEFTLDEKTNFVNKYTKRYERMYYFLNSQLDILVINVNHYDNIYNKKWKLNSLILLKESLKNPNIHILAINYVDNSFVEDRITHLFLPFDSDINFQESKTNFDKNLKSCLKKIENS